MLIFDKKRESYQIVGLKQFDSTEPIVAEFLNNGQPINLADYQIRFECKKPDGNIVIDDENITIKNTCRIEMYLNEQVTVVNGKVKCQFVLVNKTDERQTTTFTFDMDIQQSVIGINGYSSSVITVAERLNTNVIEGDKLHKALSTDIVNANQTKQELTTKVNEANTSINSLTEKTNAGNQTVSQLVEKSAIATTKKTELESTIADAIEKDGMLTRTTTLADTTNVTLQQTVDGARADINKIINVGNKYIVVTSAQFNGSREYTWKHDMNNDNLVVNFIDSTTNEPLVPDYKIVDKNNMLIRNSVEHPNIKVVASASNWQGLPLIGTTAEDFSGTTIGVGSNVRLKDANGYKYPVTKAEAVYMPDGITKVTDEITRIDEKIGQSSGAEIEAIKIQLEEIMNNLPSYYIRNYAKFRKESIRKGFEITLYGGNVQYTAREHADAVIDELMPIEPSSKYEILLYQAEEVYISEYSMGVFVRQTKLAEGYKWVYGSDSNLEEYGSTYDYISPSAFSYFITNMNTDAIKVSFKCSDYTTSSTYFPVSNTLMLDNAINSLKIVKVSKPY